MIRTLTKFNRLQSLRSLLLSCVSALFAGIALPQLLPARTSQPARYAKRSSDQTATFRIPAVRIPLNIKGQPVTIAASAVITLIRQEHGQNILKLELSADLADVQQNMTSVVSSELDKSDHCGDHIAVQNATLTPAAPASAASVQLHYERWACAKVFGKQEAKRLTAGDAIVQMTLTPAVGEDNAELRLVPEVGPIEANGSLGELLRSGALGDMLRQKIRDSILHALQKAPT